MQQPSAAASVIPSVACRHVHHACDAMCGATHRARPARRGCAGRCVHRHRVVDVSAMHAGGGRDRAVACSGTRQGEEGLCAGGPGRSETCQFSRGLSETGGGAGVPAQNHACRCLSCRRTCSAVCARPQQPHAHACVLASAGVVWRMHVRGVVKPRAQYHMIVSFSSLGAPICLKLWPVSVSCCQAVTTRRFGVSVERV